MNEQKEEGLKWFKPPYGYRLDPEEKGHLVLDEVAAPIVKRIFTSAINGMSYTAIADDLNNSGIPSPGQYKLQQGYMQTDRIAGDSWYFVAVRRIVLNPVYTGRSCKVPKTYADIQAAEKLPKTHDPIVSDEEFEAASTLNEKLETSTPFDGLLFCATCGAPMGIKGGEDGYMICRKQHARGRGKCRAVAQVKYMDLRKLVVDDLNDILSHMEKEREGEETAKEQNSIPVPVSNEERILQIQKRISLIDRIVMRIYEDRDSGLLLPRSADSMIGKYQEEISSLLDEENGLQQPQIESAPAVLHKEKIRTELTEDDLTAELLGFFVEKIKVGPQTPSLVNREGTENGTAYDQQIEIVYSFTPSALKPAVQ